MRRAVKREPPRWVMVAGWLCIAQGVGLVGAAGIHFSIATGLKEGALATLRRTMGAYDPGFLILSHPWPATALLVAIAAYCLGTGTCVLGRHPWSRGLLEGWAWLLMASTLIFAFLVAAGLRTRDPAFQVASDLTVVIVIGGLQVLAVAAFLVFLRSRRGRAGFAPPGT